MVKRAVVASRDGGFALVMVFAAGVAFGQDRGAVGVQLLALALVGIPAARKFFARVLDRAGR